MCHYKQVIFGCRTGKAHLYHSHPVLTECEQGYELSADAKTPGYCRALGLTNKIPKYNRTFESHQCSFCDHSRLKSVEMFVDWTAGYGAYKEDLFLRFEGWAEVGQDCSIVHWVNGGKTSGLPTGPLQTLFGLEGPHSNEVVDQSKR